MSDEFKTCSACKTWVGTESERMRRARVDTGSSPVACDLCGNTIPPSDPIHYFTVDDVEGNVHASLYHT